MPVSNRANELFNEKQSQNFDKTIAFVFQNHVVEPSARANAAFENKLRPKSSYRFWISIAAMFLFFMGMGVFVFYRKNAGDSVDLANRNIKKEQKLLSKSFDDNIPSSVPSVAEAKLKSYYIPKNSITKIEKEIESPVTQNRQELSNPKPEFEIPIKELDVPVNMGLANSSLDDIGQNHDLNVNRNEEVLVILSPIAADETPIASQNVTLVIPDYKTIKQRLVDELGYSEDGFIASETRQIKEKYNMIRARLIN